MRVPLSLIKRAINPFIRRMLSWLRSTYMIEKHTFITIVVVVVIVIISIIMLNRLCFPETLRVLHSICDEVSTCSTIVFLDNENDLKHHQRL
jgi:hypothetical protein